MIITSANFTKSASKHSECPSADFPEFAFIGRSNVGKSSLINMLTQRKSLAKVSGTPGKTTLLNYFFINENRYLVDLPGYGYAKHTKKERLKWVSTLWEYFIKRPTLKTVFLLIDGSILPQHIDLEFIEILQEENIPFDIVITKTDKCSQKELHRNITLLKSEVENILNRLPNIFYTSNTKGRGKNEILEHIEQLIKNEV